MSTRRRRTRTGLPVAVIIAILTAIFGGRLAQRQGGSPAPAPAAAQPRSAPATAPTTNGSTGAAAAAPRNSAGFSTRRHLEEHFEKHGEEFPGLDMAGYLRAAQLLRDAPLSGTVLEARRSDGVITRFDRSSGAFLAANRDGTIRTFFRPNDGEAYFRRQASRTARGGT